MTTLKEQILRLNEKDFSLGDIRVRPIADDYDLWYATVECRVTSKQQTFINPAGFDIGRAYLHPENHMPCLICREDGMRIGFIVFRRWPGEQTYYNWAYHLDQGYQGRGYGRSAATLAVRILQRAFPGCWIKLSVEPDNQKAQSLYQSLGFHKLDEVDGDDLIYGLKKGDSYVPDL